MDANTYPAEPHRLPGSRLWYGFAAAAAAWTLEGAIGVIVSAQFCPADSSSWQIQSEPGVKAALAVITLVLLAVAISGGMVAFRNWRALSARRDLAHAEGVSREAFMSFGGVIVSAVFVIGILWAGIPLLMLQQCLRGQ